MERLEMIRGRSKKMTSKIRGRTSVLVLLLIVVSVLLVCAEGWLPCRTMFFSSDFL